MSLLNIATQVHAKIPKFLETLRSGTAPTNFSRQHLKDIGFKSSNDHIFISLLKGLGFLTSDGAPTERYRNFLDGSKWNQILAEAVKEEYSDIFIIKAKPSSTDLAAIQGKFKSSYNISDLQAERAARTFLALLALCDKNTLYGKDKSTSMPESKEDFEVSPSSSVGVTENANASQNTKIPVGLNYNIQIHLPATKDIEVYNAIFKSLREHVID